MLILTAGEDTTSINEEAVPKYTKCYTDSGNNVIVKNIEGAPHDFEGFESQLTEIVLRFLPQ